MHIFTRDVFLLFLLFSLDLFDIGSNCLCELLLVECNTIDEGLD